MARIESSSLPNGLPLHRVELPTRSTTVLVAFDAGARTERPEENGMAHFLEFYSETKPCLASSNCDDAHLSFSQ